MSENQQSMMIVSQEHMGEKTFSLIPTTINCPYTECIYIPQTKQLAVISRIQKDTFHFFPKLDDNGDLIPVKRARANGHAHKEERKPIKTFYEYYLTDEKEILDFIKTFAFNYTTAFKISNYTGSTSKKK